MDHNFSAEHEKRINRRAIILILNVHTGHWCILQDEEIRMNKFTYDDSLLNLTKVSLGGTFEYVRLRRTRKFRSLKSERQLVKLVFLETELEFGNTDFSTCSYA